MAWVKHTHHCFARTASGGTCWSQVPYEGLRCQHHKGQRTKSEEDDLRMAHTAGLVAK